jgi:hypothetical protein
MAGVCSTNEGHVWAIGRKTIVRETIRQTKM